MALETLSNIKEIGGHKVGRIKEKDECIGPEFIQICENSITFDIQKGPVKENGVNGCQIDTLIETAKMILLELNKKYDSEFNWIAISHLGLALDMLESRKRDRVLRKVEGRNEA